MRKGMAEIIVAIILVVVAISIAFTFYFFSGGAIKKVGEAAEKTFTQEELKAKSGIYIDSVVGDLIYLKNSGQVNLTNTSFAAILNSSGPNTVLVKILDDNATNGKLAPGQLAKIKVCRLP